MKKKLFYTSIFLFLLCTASQSQNLDSLWKIYNNKSTIDSLRLISIHKIANFYIYTNPDSAILVSEKEIQFAKEKNNEKFESKALHSIALAYSNKINYAKALEYFLKSLKLAENNGYKSIMVSCYDGIASCYLAQSRREEGLAYRFKALKIAEEINDKPKMGSCYLNIGGFYQGSDSEKSLEYKLKALRIFQDLKNSGMTALCYNQIGNIYFNKKDYQKTLEYYLKSLSIKKDAFDYLSVGSVYNRLGNYKIARKYLDSANIIDKKTENSLWFKNSYLYESQDNWSNLKEFEKAYNEFWDYQTIADSLFGDKSKKELAEAIQKHEEEKKLEIKKLKDEIELEEKKREKLIFYSICGVLVIVIIFSILLFRRFKITNKQKHIIEIKNKETEEQKHLIEEKQKEIIESITYAKRLQEAILPPQEFLNKHLPNNFFLYLPKDIVAGDFYWCEHVNNLTFIAAADSTGHGVPGAMVSVVCSNALNRSLKEFHLTETGKILDKTRELVLETFEKSTSEVKDGMDISLLCINNKTKQVFWSGANNPLWYIQEGELKEVKANKQPIGKTENPTPFTTHEIEYKENTSFYLFTDGFADQFGGPNGKKFKYKPMAELLLKNHLLSNNEQHTELNRCFDSWKGNLEQVDDVCVIGIKI